MIGNTSLWPVIASEEQRFQIHKDRTNVLSSLLMNDGDMPARRMDASAAFGSVLLHPARTGP
jgi:hypothetical protein